MTTNTSLLAGKYFLATAMTQRWHDFWRGEIGQWVITRGLHVVMLLIGAVLAVRLVTWVAERVTRRLDVGFA